MKIGDSVSTLPTVKPKLYAGKTGTIAIKNDGELGVLIAGRVVWFLEREIEECKNAQSTKNPGCREISADANAAPTTSRNLEPVRTTDARRKGSTPESTPPRETSTSTREGGLGTQERAREGEAVGERVQGEQSTGPGEQEGATTNPPRGEEGQEGRSVPEDDSGPSSPSPSLLGLKPGERGPGGGVVAACEGCRELWERPKARGRPSLNCPRCR